MKYVKYLTSVYYDGRILGKLMLTLHFIRGNPLNKERKGYKMGKPDVIIPGLKPDVLNRLSVGDGNKITEADIKAFRSAVDKLRSPSVYQKNLIADIKKRIAARKNSGNKSAKSTASKKGRKK